jgi:hypothetical protein
MNKKKQINMLKCVHLYNASNSVTTYYADSIKDFEFRILKNFSVL